MGKIAIDEMAEIRDAVVDYIKNNFFLVPRKPEIQTKDKVDVIEYVADFVCDREGVTVDTVKSVTQKAQVVRARYIIFYFTRRLTKGYISYSVIGSFFNRDHATVLHGIRSIEGEMGRSPRFKMYVDEMFQAFNEEYNEKLFNVLNPINL